MFHHRQSRGSLRTATILCLVITLIALAAVAYQMMSHEPMQTTAKAQEQGPKRQPFDGEVLFASSHPFAWRQALAWQQNRPDDARRMEWLATVPKAEWVGKWTADVYLTIDDYVSAALKAHALPIIVSDFIPKRDCASNGAKTEQEYLHWIQDMALAIDQRKAIVILEPNALSDFGCLSSADRQNRWTTISRAVAMLKAHPTIGVYIDAGHPGWAKPDKIAYRLTQAGIEQADGFALNISNFQPLAANVEYGTAISDLLAGKHFIVDTSRNGIEVASTAWCNPPKRSIGTAPTTDTGNPLIDAYIWIKPPGESDGPCQGGPAQGEWWADYALSLTRNTVVEK